MNKPAVVINNVVSVSTSDEAELALVAEMEKCCDGLKGRRCPVQNQCRRFFDQSCIFRTSYKNYKEKLAGFYRIKHKRDELLKQPQYIRNKPLQRSNHNGKHSPNNTDANRHKEYAYYAPATLKE